MLRDKLKENVARITGPYLVTLGGQPEHRIEVFSDR